MATLRETVCALDPDTLVACDEAAADALREAYVAQDYISDIIDYVDTCPAGVLELGDEHAQVVDADSCVACGA